MFISNIQFKHTKVLVLFLEELFEVISNDHVHIGQLDLVHQYYIVISM